MFKKIALATAIAAIASSAFAMEALDEETLSATTGQAGLTIEMGTNVTIGHLRYTDTDGVNDTDFGALATGYNNAGTVDISNLAISATNVKLDLDVGSTDAADPANDVTALFVKQSVTGLNVSIGQLSLDSGSVLATSVPNSASFGAISLSDISLSGNSVMRITPGGALGKQGVTIANNSGASNISLGFSFTDGDNGNYTVADAPTPADVGQARPAGTLALANYTDAASVYHKGIEIAGLTQGTLQIDAVGGATGGLRVTTGNMHVDSVKLGADGAGGGIQINGASIGQVGLLNVNVGSNVITVRGH